MKRFGVTAIAWAGAICLAGAAERPPVFQGFDEQLEAYGKTQDSSELKRLQERVEAGCSNLSYEPEHGYLLSLLAELKVPVSSQILVGSKTSPNKTLISPQTPRALFFNDQVSVAYVPSAERIELAASDPELGAVFYTLTQKPSPKPQLIRDDRCLECHATSKTLNVPSPIVRSFLTGNDGEVDILSGVFVTHRTPIAERWGGYYVTGTYPAQRHRGNVFGQQSDAIYLKGGNGNIVDLRGSIDVTRYPEPGSDVAALLVLEHQAYLQALLARLALDSNKALAAGEDLHEVFPLSETVLKYMLFIGEAPLKGPVSGSGQFSEWFQRQGPRDRQGRSLRQFDLVTRTFKFPCSFMIYSPSFETLPVRARRHLYHRLHEVLSGEDGSAEFLTIPAEKRLAIREILIDTLTDLPLDWGLETNRRIE